MKLLIAIKFMKSQGKGPHYWLRFGAPWSLTVCKSWLRARGGLFIKAFAALAQVVSSCSGNTAKTLGRNATMVRGTLVLPVLLLTVSCSFLGIRSGLEHSNYEVLEVLSKDLEIRRYGSRRAIETTLQGRDREKARRRAFRRLFNYISGANEPGSKIAMTAPVETATGAGQTNAKIAMTAPVSTAASNNAILMRFFLPSGLSTETIPGPTDPQVRVVTVPEQTMAARSFSGRASEGDVAAQKNRLTDELASTHWEAQGAVTAYFYDPPWTLPFLRRNEVVVIVRGGKE